MTPVSIIAIYVLIWVISAFCVMPFGLRTSAEAGTEAEMIPGQADSAPVNFNGWRVALRATVMAMILFALFYANYLYGWVDASDLDFFGDATKFPLGY